MKKTLLSILLIFIVSIVGCNSQQTPTKEQSSKVENKQKVDYELQERCSKSSEEFIKREYGELKQYVNHYNKKQNKCFIHVTILYPNDNKKGFSSIQHLLYDVHENDNIGQIQQNLTTKPPPILIICHVMDKSCSSLEEWYSLINPYMTE